MILICSTGLILFDLFWNLAYKQETCEYLPNSKSINYCFATSIFSYLYKVWNQIENNYDLLKKIIETIKSNKKIIWQKGYYDNNDKKASNDNSESYFFFNTVSKKSVDARISYIEDLIKMQKYD